MEELLGVPVLSSGTGESQASAVYETLLAWKLTDRITSMCFDTTASNTGLKSGACTLLEQKLGKELFSLVCRHHVHELIVKSAFDSLFGPSSEPNIKLFERFQEAWDSIDHERYKSGMEDDKICGFLLPIRDEMIKFIEAQLSSFQPRNDYRELLLLILIFLDSNSKKHIKIYIPGAYHRARWMAKLIYCMKIYIFRDQFHLRAAELYGLQQFNIFVVRVYLQKWYTCQCPAFAPLNDLLLLKDLVYYSTVNNKIS